MDKLEYLERRLDLVEDTLERTLRLVEAISPMSLLEASSRIREEMCKQVTALEEESKQWTLI